jgi:hypothetical protein
MTTNEEWPRFRGNGPVVTAKRAKEGALAVQRITERQKPASGGQYTTGALQHSPCYGEIFDTDARTVLIWSRSHGAELEIAECEPARPNGHCRFVG